MDKNSSVIAVLLYTESKLARIHFLLLILVTDTNILPLVSMAINWKNSSLTLIAFTHMQKILFY